MSTAAAPALSSSNGNTPDWAKLRAEFPLLENWAFLNVAQKAPVPRETERAIEAWLNDTYADAGEAAFSMDEIEKTREAVAATFGMPPRNTALVKNTSEGINIIAQGLPLGPGDNVVISTEEHENNTFPWRHLAGKGVELRFATPDPLGRITVDTYRKLIDARTRVISAAWVTYGIGYRTDVLALSELCHKHDIVLVVDGVQAVGVLADRVDALGADVVVAGGHKAQFSLAGAGLMYVRDTVIDRIRPPYAAKFSFVSNDRTNSAPELAHDAHRFEYGNPNFLGCWVQRRSAEFLRSIGLASIEERVKELTTYLIEGLDEARIHVRTPRPWKERAGIVSIDVGSKAGEVVKRARAEGVVISEKDGHPRASVHFFNNQADIDRLIACLTKA